MSKEERIAVAAAVLVDSGKVMLARRKKGKHLEGYWEFPGGKIEAGESGADCLRRELGEEFGVETEIGSLIASVEHSYSQVRIRLDGYWARITGGRFSLTDHDRVVWVAATELLSFQLSPADVPIAEKILEEGGPCYKV